MRRALFHRDGEQANEQANAEHECVRRRPACVLSQRGSVVAQRAAPGLTMLAATARRLATAGRPRSLAALAQAAPKLDWSEVSARCSGDEAKREVAKLKKTVEDLKEMLATQAKVWREQEEP